MQPNFLCIKMKIKFFIVSWNMDLDGHEVTFQGSIINFSVSSSDSYYTTRSTKPRGFCFILCQPLMSWRHVRNCAISVLSDSESINMTVICQTKPEAWLQLSSQENTWGKMKTRTSIYVTFLWYFWTNCTFYLHDNSLWMCLPWTSLISP